MNKNKRSILLKIFDGSKMLFFLAVTLEVIICVCVFYWWKNISILLMALTKNEMCKVTSILYKIGIFVGIPQVVRYFFQMPTLDKLYRNINSNAKIIAYDYFSKINMSNLDNSTYLRVNLLGEYINTTLFNILTLTRDRTQLFLIAVISLLLNKFNYGVIYLFYIVVYLYIMKGLVSFFYFERRLKYKFASSSLNFINSSEWDDIVILI